MDLKTLLAGDTSNIVVRYADEDVKVTYRKTAFTPALEAAITREDGGQALAELVSALVEDWDLTDDGEPYPPTRENVANLPYLFLVAVAQTVTKEVAADPLLVGTSVEPS